jgi:S-formylglutathione hydrolase FrmB
VAEPISRRALLVGSAGVAVAAGLGRLVVGRHRDPTGVPHARVDPLITGSFVSAKRGGVKTGWALSFPPGDLNAPLPVLIALHGRGSDHTAAFGGGLHLDRFLADAVRTGTPPFGVASIDGGDHSYWHPRRDGDATAMVLEEFLPLLVKQGADPHRIGLFGWSMGGYGALYLAGRLGARGCKVAIAESPAIWHEAGQSADGAFDDAADFDAHSIFGHLDALKGIPLRIDCGTSDGFAPVTRELRAALSPTPAGGLEPGKHDMTYWRSQAAAQLRFAGQHLSA